MPLEPDPLWARGDAGAALTRRQFSTALAAGALGAALPGLPVYMPGVTQVRGEVMSVVDLGRWLGAPNCGAPGFLAIVAGPLP